MRKVCYFVALGSSGLSSYINITERENTLRKNLTFIFQIVPVVSTLVLLVSCAQANQGSSTHPQSMFLVIRNSGSTNFPGFTITANNDGSGTLIYEKCRSAPTRPQCQKPNKTFSSQTFQINTIRLLLSQIGSIQNIPNHSCVKSVSFGSVTKISYNGQESGDISCIGSADPQTYQHLKNEVDAFISQAMQ